MSPHSVKNRRVQYDRAEQSSRMQERPSQRWVVACDESGVGGETHYGFGSIWMPARKLEEFNHEFGLIKKATGYPHEVSWKKKNNTKYLQCFLDMVDFFFKTDWLSFHCLIVRKGEIDKSLHDGDYDLARRKFYTELLANKAQRCIAAHPSRRNAFTVFVDPIASREPKADECMKVISNNILREMSELSGPIENVITVDSKTTPAVQLADLLVGAVNDHWTGRSDSEAAARIKCEILDALGWTRMSDTHPSERKFNIWYFWDEARGPRPVETQLVNHRHPLPPRVPLRIPRAASDRYRRSTPNARPTPRPTERSGSRLVRG